MFLQTCEQALWRELLQGNLKYSLTLASFHLNKPLCMLTLVSAAVTACSYFIDLMNVKRYLLILDFLNADFGPLYCIFWPLRVGFCNCFDLAFLFSPSVTCVYNLMTEPAVCFKASLSCIEERDTAIIVITICLVCNRHACFFFGGGVSIKHWHTNWMATRSCHTCWQKQFKEKNLNLHTYIYF